MTLKICALFVSNDNKYLFTGSYKTIKQWHINNGQEIKSFIGHGDII